MDTGLGGPDMGSDDLPSMSGVDTGMGDSDLDAGDGFDATPAATGGEEELGRARR